MVDLSFFFKILESAISYMNRLGVMDRLFNDASRQARIVFQAFVVIVIKVI